MVYFPHFGGKNFFPKNLAVIHNTTWASNTMEKTKEPIPRKLLNRRMDGPYSHGPSGHGQESYKRISQLSGIAADNKDKIQFNSA